MSERTTTDRVGECVHVLRAMGVPPSDVADRYGASGSDPVAALSETLSDTSDRRLYDLLHESVARSDRGIECQRDHDLATAVDALGEALARYDCTLSVRGEDPLTVEAEDAADETRSTTVSLPAALPDGDPLPAVAGAVDRDLLDGTGLTLVLLSEREDVWRLALLPERRLTDLQERLGVRLSVFGRALLCADQPRAFLEGRARAYAPATDGGVATAGDGVAATGGDAVAPTVETPVDPATLGESRHESPDPSPRVETGAVDRLLADLSAVLDGQETDGTADPSGSTVEVGGGPTRTVGEGVDDIVTAVTGGLGGDAAALSDAFDTVEREAAGPADDGPAGSAAAVGGGPTRVVADESVEAVLSSVGVCDAGSDLDLDEALASMAGEFDEAPSLPEPLAAARNGR